MKKSKVVRIFLSFTLIICIVLTNVNINLRFLFSKPSDNRHFLQFGTKAFADALLDTGTYTSYYSSTKNAESDYFQITASNGNLDVKACTYTGSFTYPLIKTFNMQSYNSVQNYKFTGYFYYNDYNTLQMSVSFIFTFDRTTNTISNIRSFSGTNNVSPSCPPAITNPPTLSIYSYGITYSGGMKYVANLYSLNTSPNETFLKGSGPEGSNA